MGRRIKTIFNFRVGSVRLTLVKDLFSKSYQFNLERSTRTPKLAVKGLNSLTETLGIIKPKNRLVFDTIEGKREANTVNFKKLQSKLEEISNV